MKTVIALAAIGCAVVSAVGQATEFHCDESTLMQIHGKWSDGAIATQGADSSFPKSQHPEVKTRIRAMVELLRETYPQPMGLDVSWSGQIAGISYLKDGPLPFYVSGYFFPYFCNGLARQSEPSGETATFVKIWANSFGGEDSYFERVGDWTIGGKLRTVFRLPPRVGTWKGQRLMEPTGCRDRYRICRAVLIGHLGRLPIVVLTRRQFLEAVRARWQQREASDGRMRPFYEAKIAVADRLLTELSSADLALPAILSRNRQPEEFDGQFSTEAEGGTAVFHFPAAYFQKDTPRGAPQFLLLLWQVATNSPAAQAFADQFESTFPIEKLQAMVDK